MALYLLLISPALLSFALSWLFYSRVKHRWLRHGGLLLPLALFVLAPIAYYGGGGGFIDLSNVAAMLLTAMGVSALLGCGLAWWLVCCRRSKHKN